MEKLFIVCPGPITSINDWNHHHISAPQLMDLFGVRPEECIIVRSKEDLQGWRGLLDRGMEVLHPMVTLYRPYDERGRQVIRERIAARA